MIKITICVDNVDADFSEEQWKKLHRALNTESLGAKLSEVVENELMDKGYTISYEDGVAVEYIHINLIR